MCSFRLFIIVIEYSPYFCSLLLSVCTTIATVTLAVLPLCTKRLKWTEMIVRKFYWSKRIFLTDHGVRTGINPRNYVLFTCAKNLKRSTTQQHFEGFCELWMVFRFKRYSKTPRTPRATRKFPFHQWTVKNSLIHRSLRGIFFNFADPQVKEAEHSELVGPWFVAIYWGVI